MAHKGQFILKLKNFSFSYPLVSLLVKGKTIYVYIVNFRLTLFLKWEHTYVFTDEERFRYLNNILQ